MASICKKKVFLINKKSIFNFVYCSLERLYHFDFILFYLILFTVQNTGRLTTRSGNALDWLLSQMLLILTLARSGSTFLGSIFNSHPDVMYHFEQIVNSNHSTMSLSFYSCTLMRFNPSCDVLWIPKNTCQPWFEPGSTYQ